MIELKDYSEKIGIPIEQLYKSQYQPTPIARQVYWHYLKKNGYGYCEIGRMFNKTHPTIIYGIKNIQNMIETNNIIINRYFEALEIDLE